MFKEAGLRSPRTQLTKVKIEISVLGRHTEAIIDLPWSIYKHCLWKLWSNYIKKRCIFCRPFMTDLMKFHEYLMSRVFLIDPAFCRCVHVWLIEFSTSIGSRVKNLGLGWYDVTNPSRGVAETGMWHRITRDRDFSLWNRY